jgi:hypothetical protein
LILQELQEKEQKNKSAPTEAGAHFSMSINLSQKRLSVKKNYYESDKYLQHIGLRFYGAPPFRAAFSTASQDSCKPRFVKGLEVWPHFVLDKRFYFAL